MVPEPHCAPPAPLPGPRDTRFLRHPYEAGAVGHTVQARRADRSVPGRTVWARVAAEGGVISKTHGRARVAARIGGRILEWGGTAHGLVRAEDHDSLAYGTSTLALPLVAKRLSMRVGGGIRYALRSRVPQAGVDTFALGWNVTTGADYFPLRPFVLSSRIDVGRLPTGWVAHWRGSVGVMLRGVEVLASADYLLSGQARIGGPMLGFRLWI